MPRAGASPAEAGGGRSEPGSGPRRTDDLQRVLSGDGKTCLSGQLLVPVMDGRRCREPVVMWQAETGVRGKQPRGRTRQRSGEGAEDQRRPAVAVFARPVLCDFISALEQFLGSSAGLSASTVTSLTEQWQQEQKQFAQRDLSGVDYVRVWADGHREDHR